jgi:hypothetical protein
MTVIASVAKQSRKPQLLKKNIYTKFETVSEKLTVKRFLLNKRTQCFSENPIAPVIKLENDVPQHFLRRGNRVEFI